MPNLTPTPLSNRSDQLSMRELEAGLNSVGIWLHDNALREAFEILDTDRSGRFMIHDSE